MALDWYFGKIENFKQVCFQNGKMNPITHSLVFATMVIGVNEITKKNWAKFYARLNFWERVNGSYLLKKGKPFLISAEEVKRHIGLSTNARVFSDTKFLRNFSMKLKDVEQSIGV